MTEGYDKDLDRLKSLTSELHKASVAYYQDDKPFMSDKNYDDLYDELEALENKMGISLAGSPTHTVGCEVVSKLEKVTHSHPMLSLGKTKSPDDLVKFSSGKDCIISLKMDGLTTLCTYQNGELVQAETRGNGEIGELITHNAKVFEGLPLKIPFDRKFEIEGEAIIRYSDFEMINQTIKNPDDKYKNPRNLASGSVRQLDSNITKNRHVRFVVWKVPFGLTTFTGGFRVAAEWGFEVVPYVKYNSNTDDINEKIEELKQVAKEKDYPIDGLVITYDNIEYGKSLGMTSHHPRHSLAFKFYEDEEETELKTIEWSIGKTGVLTPVAVFESVEIDGTTIEKASIHNISVMQEVLHRPFVGQKIGVFKSNQIIPQIRWGEPVTEQREFDDIMKLSFINIPQTCPVCGGETKIVKENDSEVLVCTNPDCQGKLLYKLSHFASRNALNIEGLSESTIQFLLKRKWVSCFKDLYHLKDHEIEWRRFPGFGTKSVTGILTAIEKSRETTLDRFLYGLSIPMVGRSASEMIAKACDYDFGAFMQIMTLTGAKFFNYLDGVGDSIIKSMDEYFNKECSNIFELSKEFNFNVPKVVNLSLSSEVSGKTFVITGSVEHFPNRDAVKDAIVNHGGKVVGSVSAKVDYLVNNDINSTSSKNKKAKELGVKIITENELIKMLGD